jgi:hypothetical protein
MSRCARDPFDGLYITLTANKKKKTDQYLLRSWTENELQTFGEYEKGGPIDVRKVYRSFL